MTTDSRIGPNGDDAPDQQERPHPPRNDRRAAVPPNPPPPSPPPPNPPPPSPPPAWPAPPSAAPGWPGAAWPTPRRDGASSYPIVAQLELDDPARRWTGKRRDKSQIPKIKAHEVLVWRVGNKYIVDSRQLRDSDDVVVDASSVSVVSVRRGTEVEVSFTIDSRDASVFTVKVTFVCSVTDPDVVVRDGQVNVADTLLAYLRGYQDLFSVGLKYRITEINDARAEMAKQVKAYMTLRPAKIPGIEIDPSPTVQVKTPLQVASYEDDARRHWIEMQRQAAEAELEMARQGLMLDKAARLNDAVTDPAHSLGIAVASGDMSTADQAERLLQRDAERQQREQVERVARETRQYAVADRVAEWDHNEHTERIAWERAQIEREYADAQEERRRAYAVEDRGAQWAHEEEKDKIGWERAQIESQRAEKQEGIRRLMEAEEKYLEVLAQVGHLDTHVEDVSEVMRRIRRTAAGPDPSQDQSALPQGAQPQGAQPQETQQQGTQQQAEAAGPDGGHDN